MVECWNDGRLERWRVEDGRDAGSVEFGWIWLDLVGFGWVWLHGLVGFGWMDLVGFTLIRLD